MEKDENYETTSTMDGVKAYEKKSRDIETCSKLDVETYESVAMMSRCRARMTSKDWYREPVCTDGKVFTESSKSLLESIASKRASIYRCGPDLL